MGTGVEPGVDGAGVEAGVGVSGVGVSGVVLVLLAELVLGWSRTWRRCCACVFTRRERPNQHHIALVRIAPERLLHSLEETPRSHLRWQRHQDGRYLVLI